MMANPYLRYRAAAVETAAPVDLVVMLYQGVVRFTQRGIDATERRDLETAHASFVRAQEIVAELAGSLDLEAGGQVARGLMALYDYTLRRLVEANCGKTAGPAREVAGLFRELLPAWQDLAAGARPAGLGQDSRALQAVAS